jgi:hypothetical protein
MVYRISSFVCPVIKDGVQMRLGYVTDYLLSEVDSCSGWEACGMQKHAAGQAHFEWKQCPVLRSHLGVPAAATVIAARESSVQRLF